jgi:LacI family transcriptional regulator
MSPRKRQSRHTDTPKPPTIKEVAEYADVSTATVSRVLSGQQVVKDELIERVRSAVTALEYRPNRLSRNLRKRSTEIIGVVVSDLQNRYVLGLVKSIQAAAEEAGYFPMLCDSSRDPQREMVYLSTLRTDGVAGIVLVPSAGESEELRKFIRIGPPVVTVDAGLDRIPVDCVRIDNQAAAEMAVQHLVEHGRKRIAIISSSNSTSAGKDINRGYQNALEKAGIQKDDDTICDSVNSQDGGYRQMMRLLDLPARPDAVITVGALISLGALGALAERGIHLPEEMGIVSLDDAPWSALVSPQLTAVDRNPVEVGAAAVRLLVERMKNLRQPAREMILQPRLSTRESA